MAYKAPVRDFSFILSDVLDIDRYSNVPGFADVSSDLVTQILRGRNRPEFNVVGEADEREATWMDSAA